MQHIICIFDKFKEFLKLMSRRMYSYEILNASTYFYIFEQFEEQWISLKQSKLLQYLATNITSGYGL